MFDRIELGTEFFEGLLAIDVAIVERAAREPCPDCGGPLYRGDYPRKPRGGRIAVFGEGFDRRFSAHSDDRTPAMSRRKRSTTRRPEPGLNGALPGSR